MTEFKCLVSQSGLSLAWLYGSRVHAGRHVDHPIISFGQFEMIGLCKDWRQSQTLDIFLLVVRAFDLLFAVRRLKDFLQI